MSWFLIKYKIGDDVFTDTMEYRNSKKLKTYLTKKAKLEVLSIEEMKEDLRGLFIKNGKCILSPFNRELNEFIKSFNYG